MTLFRIALRNIRKNSYDYLMYFVSMVFSIMVYYAFACIKYNESFMVAIGGSTKLSAAFSGANVVMALFSVVFIWYSNMFFTKKRKKEFGLYSLMGVKKKHIGRMYFYETILIGCLATVCGILLGTFLSKFFNMILVKAMGLDLNVEFFFGWNQVIETAIIFFAIFIVVSFQGYYISYRYKLIDMFTSAKRKDEVPKSNAFLAILSIVLIIGAYVMSHTFFFMNPLIGFFATLITAILGTYIFFRHFVMLGINMAKKNPNHYYRKGNMIATSLLFYRIKSNYRTLATIAIMSAVTLTVVGTAYSFYYGSSSKTSSIAPFSLCYEWKDDALDDEVEGLILDENHQLLYAQTVPLLKTKFTIDLRSDVEQKRTFTMNGISGAFMSESTYESLGKHLNIFEAYGLSAGETVWLMKDYIPQFEPDYKRSSLHTNDLNKSFFIKNFAARSLINNTAAWNILVVTDDDYALLKNDYTESVYRVVDYSRPRESRALSKRLIATLENRTNYSLYYSEYISGMATNGLFIYIAGFLGIVFLIATCTIIFFKQLTEATDDWQKYRTLDKIGITTSEMKLIVKKQMRVVFGTPLLLGICHAAFALDVLATALGSNLIIPIVISFSIYLLIYVIFYFMTCSAYYKVIHSYK